LKPKRNLKILKAHNIQYDKVCQGPTASWWFSPKLMFSSPINGPP
jgi:hypothetical protein